MALAKDRHTPARSGQQFTYPLAAALVYAGSIGVINASGYLTKGATATGLKCVGRISGQVDNSAGNAGDVTGNVENGVFQWANSAAGDAITLAEVGTVCYIVDDQTVAKTSGGGTRSPAGIIEDVDSGGVWVRMGQDALVAPAGALLAASNLSDLDTAATARANLGGGANKIVMTLHDIDLIGANTEVKRIVSPVAGTIDKIYSVIDGALTTGDATLTAKIGAVAVTTGAITVTQAGSAAGDVDSVTPSAAKTVAVGNVISITVGGTNDAAKFANVTLLITPSA
ncbi:MAG: hypothetical protein Q8Q50_02630 [Methylobacter sp.]|nr:hypothetical protein [Methylobacter sp.]